MSWMFITAIGSLVAIMILLVALPWFWHNSETKNIHQANVAVVQQRLGELEREVEEGVLSKQDMRQASDEIKISLVEETQTEVPSKQQAASFILAFGALVALGVGGWAYYNTSNISKLTEAQLALDSLPQLSEKLAAGEGNSLTVYDFQQLTYAIRSRLQDKPDDAQGWMYLGRIWLALEQSSEAFAALEKAISYAPDDPAVRMTYVRALMTSDDIDQLRNAQRILTQLIDEQPANDNLVLMLAVVAGRVGDKDVLASTMQALDGKLPNDNPVVIQLRDRLASLNGESKSSPTLTGFSLTVEVSEALDGSLPVEGYLFVFAQDADSENRMPAAVLRMPLAELPATVTLTNQNAMAPNFTINNLKNARLVARISADPEAPAKPGDLEGQIEVEVVANRIVEKVIRIDKELMQ